MASQQYKKVLILNSYHQGIASTDKIVVTISERLKRDIENIEIFIEYLDLKRFSDSPIEKIVSNLAEKYHDTTLDLIVSTEENSLSLLANHHNQIFPHVPVVFCGIGSPEMIKDLDIDHFTGILEVLDIQATIEIALEISGQRYYFKSYII